MIPLLSDLKELSTTRMQKETKLTIDWTDLKCNLCDNAADHARVESVEEGEMAVIFEAYCDDCMSGSLWVHRQESQLNKKSNGRFVITAGIPLKLYTLRTFEPLKDCILDMMEDPPALYATREAAQTSIVLGTNQETATDRESVRLLPYY